MFICDTDVHISFFLFLLSDFGSKVINTYKNKLGNIITFSDLWVYLPMFLIILLIDWCIEISLWADLLLLLLFFQELGLFGYFITWIIFSKYYFFLGIFSYFRKIFNLLPYPIWQNPSYCKKPAKQGYKLPALPFALKKCVRALSFLL